MPATLGDEIQKRYRVANHEAGHAVAMHLLDRPIHEIDIDRPDRWVAGWVVPGEPEPIPAPPGSLDHAAALEWIDARLSKDRRETAITARMGGLAAGDDWYDAGCSADRALVLRACPDGFDPSSWEMFVLLFAEDLREDPRFRPAHLALSVALSDRPHDIMPGARAVELIEEALRDQ